MNPKIELISTGSELLSGRTINRHASVLAGMLAPLGISLARDTTVPDDITAIADALSSAMGRVDVVLVSGGLGPTEDDITRDAVARVLGRRVVMDQGARAALRERLQQLGRQVTPMVERQALIVEGAWVLPNPVGFAPGERVDSEGKTVFLLPGPPEEFRAVLEAHVIPWLRGRFPRSRPLLGHTFMICGLGESGIMERFREAGFPFGEIHWAYCAAPGRVELKLMTESEALFKDAVEQARALLGDYVFSETGEAMEAVVGRLLRERKATLAVAESCTGGLLGARITQQPGSSDYFLGGVIAYSNAAKTRWLDVPEDILQREGAVSRTTAAIMAESVRRRFDATYGVSVTGIAGPTGGTPEKPVGSVYIAVADAQRTSVRSYRFSGGRDRIREWSVQMALDGLRRRILGIERND